MMRVGQLNRVVTLQRPVGGSPSDTGAVTDTWVDVATVRANIVPTTSREKVIAGQVGMLSSHTITMRYLSGVHPTYRLKRKGEERYWYIDGIENVEEDGVWLKLTCTEKA